MQTETSPTVPAPQHAASPRSGAPEASVNARPPAAPMSPGAAALAAHIAAQEGAAPRFAEYIHDFVLPSRGIPYVDPRTNQELLPGGKVRIRSMTGEEEAILNSSQFNDQTKLARIIDACTALTTVQGKRMDPRGLLTTDRLVLILVIRGFSLGSVYRLPCECAKCEVDFTHELDLFKALDVHEMPRKLRERGADGEVVERTYTYDPIEGVPCPLPVSGRDLRLRLLTGYDEEFIAREAAKGRNSSFLVGGVKGDPAFYLRLMLAIRSIDGREFEHSAEPDMKALCQFVRALPIRDTNFINNVYAKYDVGIPTRIRSACPACGGDVWTALRMTPEFFRPEDDLAP